MRTFLFNSIVTSLSYVLFFISEKKPVYNYRCADFPLQMQSMTYHHRSSILPQIPTTSEDTIKTDNIKYLEHDDSFIIFQDNPVLGRLIICMMLSTNAFLLSWYLLVSL